MRKFLVIIVIVLLGYSANAQIIVERIQPRSIGSSLQDLLNNAPIIEMPEFNYKWIEDEEELMRKEDMESDLLIIDPARFGYAYETKINNIDDGDWTQEGNISIWTLAIKSKGALSINLIFDEFYLSEGSEFNIYNDSLTMRFGPVTSKHNRVNRRLSTDIIKGSTIILVLIEPNTLDNIQSIISIRHVIHGFAAACEYGGATLDCHVNASCHMSLPLQDEKYAVGRYLHRYNTKCCTGSLIHNTCKDFTPYFLTAFHCVDYDETRTINQAEKDQMEDWVISFKYISPTCYPSTEPASWLTYSGAEFVAANDETDFLLVKMLEQPSSSSGLQYAGWSRYDNFPFQNEGTSGLTHPHYDVMKFFADDDEPEVNEESVRFYYSPPYGDHWEMDEGTLWRVRIDDGAVEGGSSGGPLFDPNERIIGQLIGNQLICPPDDTAYFGRLSESWDRSENDDEQLAYWLDPANTGTWTLSTAKIPSITGPDFVCYSPSETFTLLDRPSNSSVYWTYNTSLLSYVSGQGTNYFTVRAKTSYSQGQGWVQANTTVGNCDAASFRFDEFWVGKFNNTVVTGQAAVCPNTTYIYTAQVPFGNPSSYSYNWTYPSNWTKLSQEDNTVQLRTPSNPYYGTVRVSIENDCGWSNYSGITVYPGYCGGGYYLISPNPADDYLEINIDEKSNITETSEDIESLGSKSLTVIKIYDYIGRLMYSTQFREYPYKINTSNLPEGFYVIQIIDGVSSNSMHVVIER